MKKVEMIAKKSLKNKKAESSYDQMKVFEGQFYKGMKIGGRHKWVYDQGEWKETKRTPDLWQFSYQVKKRRAGKAPENSGVAVGTEYHWAILASQTVKKLDANTYSTEMHGLKYKVAYKKANQEKWSAGVKGQKQRLIKFLKMAIDSIERGEIQQLALKKIPQKSSKKNNSKPKKKIGTRKRP